VHASLNCDASNSPLNLEGGFGKPNRSGGDWANGMPRNLLIVAVAAGRDVVVPTTTPSAITAVGRLELARAAPAVAARMRSDGRIVGLMRVLVAIENDGR
jgi:hypothetical protein